MDMARRAIAEGAREIVLTGVNTGDFGKSTGERLIDLLRALDALPGDTCIRISPSSPTCSRTPSPPPPPPHAPLPPPCRPAATTCSASCTAATTPPPLRPQGASHPPPIPRALHRRGRHHRCARRDRRPLRARPRIIDALPASRLHVFTYSNGRAPACSRCLTPCLPERAAAQPKSCKPSPARSTTPFCESQIGRPARVLWARRRRADCMAASPRTTSASKPPLPLLINTHPARHSADGNHYHNLLLTIES